MRPESDVADLTSRCTILLQSTCGPATPYKALNLAEPFSALKVIGGRSLQSELAKEPSAHCVGVCGTSVEVPGATVGDDETPSDTGQPNAEAVSAEAKGVGLQ